MCPEASLTLCELAVDDPVEMKTEVEVLENSKEKATDDVLEKHDFYGANKEEDMYTDESYTSRSETLESSSDSGMSCDEPSDV